MTAGEAPHRHRPRLRQPEFDGEKGVPEIGLNGRVLVVGPSVQRLALISRMRRVS